MFRSDSDPKCYVSMTHYESSDGYFSRDSCRPLLQTTATHVRKPRELLRRYQLPVSGALKSEHNAYSNRLCKYRPTLQGIYSASRKTGLSNAAASSSSSKSIFRSSSSCRSIIIAFNLSMVSSISPAARAFLSEVYSPVGRTGSKGSQSIFFPLQPPRMWTKLRKPLQIGSRESTMGLPITISSAWARVSATNNAFCQVPFIRICCRGLTVETTLIGDEPERAPDICRYIFPIAADS